jgi:hypothetical protein
VLSTKVPVAKTRARERAHLRKLVLSTKVPVVAAF